MFAKVLTFITQRLDEAKAQGLVEQYALIGGFAVSAWGIPRATNDVDFVLALGSANPTTLSQHLNADVRAGQHEDPLRGVYQLTFSTEHHNIPIQLILLPSEWTPIIVDIIVELSVLECAIPVISWQVLVLLQLYAGGHQDLLDAQQIVDARQPSQEDVDKIAMLATRVNLLSVWQRFIEHPHP